MIVNMLKGFSRSLSKPSVAHYHEKVIDHYENPRNVGSLDKSKKNVGTGLVGAPACGDVMKLQIELNDDGTTIERAVFKVFSLQFRPLDAVQPSHRVHTRRS
jgi:iron-sulfur cluster assembly enzyme ISCU, mitochondrial